MTPGLPRRDNKATLVLALLLLVLRLAVPGLPMPSAAAEAAALAGVMGEVPICHGGTPEGRQEAPGAPAAPAHDCALCPACQLASGPALLPATAWAVVPMDVGQARFAPHPPATGPPLPHRLAARPRGPPATLA